MRVGDALATAGEDAGATILSVGAEGTQIRVPLREKQVLRFAQDDNS